MFKSKFNHYYVNDIYFSLYNEAYNYCCNNDINTASIEKTKEYRQ